LSTKNIKVNTLTIQPPLNTKQETSRDKYDNDTLKQDDGIFQYLPIDIFKSVHRILQSQPASIEGKLYFLKTFEKILMSEIGKICPHNSGALSKCGKFSYILFIDRISSYCYYGTESQNKRCRVLWARWSRSRGPLFRFPFDRRHTAGHIVPYVRRLSRSISHGKEYFSKHWSPDN